MTPKALSRDNAKGVVAIVKEVMLEQCEQLNGEVRSRMKEQFRERKEQFREVREIRLDAHRLQLTESSRSGRLVVSNDSLFAADVVC